MLLTALSGRTGLRITELRLLEFECIQIDQKGRSALIVPPVKLAIERRVPLDPATVELIKCIRSMSLKNHPKKTIPDRLIIGPLGVPPAYSNFSSTLTEICARLDIKKWINLHALRHTYATSLLNGGLSITSLKEMLGHKAINMSLLYAKVSPEKIHSEYSKAMISMGEKQIPKILETAASAPAEAFASIGNIITKSLDDCADPQKRNRLLALRIRLAKMKMELLAVL